jgi:hypothetical protein
MVQITGADRHAKRLRALRSRATQDRITMALFVGADEIKTEARLLITTGSVSGKNHVPSLPGEPPNADTRFLHLNIEAVRMGHLKARVESRAPYGMDLELGTAKMAARPYMRPATAKKRARVLELVHKVIEQAIERG